MKIKNILLALCFAGLSTTLFAQNNVVKKKSVIVSGTASFSSLGGDFSSSNSKRDLNLSLTGSANYFIIDHLFVGGAMGYSYSKQYERNANTFNIGPQIGYAFGNENSKVFPFVSGGIKYRFSKSGQTKWNGSDSFFGAGFIIPLKRHIGLTIEGKYHMIGDKANTTPTTKIKGNIFTVGVGISGLF